MKKQLHTAFAMACLFGATSASAVTFNWVRTPAPPGSSVLFDQFRPFSLTISDDVYLAAQSAPQTFGVWSATTSFSLDRLTVGPYSADVTARVRVGVGQWFNGTGTYYSVPEGLSVCASFPPNTVACLAEFTSSVVTPNQTLQTATDWGRSGGVHNTISSTITLSATGLSVAFIGSPFQQFELFTDSQGRGRWGVGADGCCAAGGFGFWQADPATIPVIPEPSRLALMLLGLLGVAAAVSRRFGPARAGV